MAEVCAEAQHGRVSEVAGRSKMTGGSGGHATTRPSKRRHNHDGRHGGRPAKVGRWGRRQSAPFHFYPGGSRADPLNLANVTGRTPTHDDEPTQDKTPVVDPNEPIEIPRNTSSHDPLGLDKPDSEVNRSGKRRKRRRRRKAKAAAKSGGGAAAPADLKLRRRRSTTAKSMDTSASTTGVAAACTSKAPEPHSSAATSDAAPPADSAACAVVKYGRLNAKRKDRFRYGNHPAGSIIAAKDDPRLFLIDQAIIRDRVVLDVGCNLGGLTVALAERCRPASITGIDIDTALIGRARDALAVYVKEQRQLSHVDMAALRAVEAVLFRSENYVLDSDDQLCLIEPMYDVILALSITKWVHLNWGDCGIKRFFRRAFAELKPSGCLILEAQDLPSYKDHVGLAEQMAKTYKDIRFLPEQFTNYLLTEVGFKSCEIVCSQQDRSVPDAQNSGRKRPMLLFRKSS